MNQRRFLVLWCLAVGASSAAFTVHLALRGKTVDVGFQLGKLRNEQGELREAKRVLELEATSYQTPKRVEMVARTLLGMNPPSAEKVIALRSKGSSPEVSKAPAVANAEPSP